MYFRVGTNIRKCAVWSQNTEPGTRLVWRVELHVWRVELHVWTVELHVSLEINSLLLNFIVPDVEFCKTKNVIKKNKIYS
jgi:hypothetical protein